MPATDEDDGHSGTLITRVESEATVLAAGKESTTVSPEAMVGEQIALVLNHMQRQRDLKSMLLRRILRDECTLDTMLLPLPGYQLDHDLGLKTWVRDRLLALQSERRRLLAEHERRSHDLESQLVALVNQRKLLGGGQDPLR